MYLNVNLNDKKGWGQKIRSSITASVNSPPSMRQKQLVGQYLFDCPTGQPTRVNDDQRYLFLLELNKMTWWNGDKPDFGNDFYRN